MTNIIQIASLFLNIIMVLLLILVMHQQFKYFFGLGMILSTIRMRIRLWFALTGKNRIPVEINYNWRSVYEASGDYFLIKIHQCSHNRYFEIIDSKGGVTLIVPEIALESINGEPTNYTRP